MCDFIIVLSCCSLQMEEVARPDPDAALRKFMDEARRSAAPSAASRGSNSGLGSPLKSLDEWVQAVEHPELNNASPLRRMSDPLLDGGLPSDTLSVPRAISTPPFEGNRHSPLPPISRSRPKR